MAKNYLCLGLEELAQDDEFLEYLIYDIVRYGNEINGYTGNPYFIKNYGSAEFVVRTERNEGEKRIHFIDLDTHTQGMCIWDVRVAVSDVDREDADKLEKRILVRHPEKGTGLAMVNILNADVLPSYLEDDLLRMQVVGLAECIDYFPSAEEFEDSIEKPDLGFRMLPAEGAVIATGFLNNRNPDSKGYGKISHLEDINLVRGIVTEVLYGTFVIDDSEDPFTPYISCRVETEFGKLEIEHTLDQVKEDQRDNIKVGSTVVAGVILSADVAIDEYEKGIVVDEHHDLKLLKYTLMKGSADRLVRRLADDCVYLSDSSGKGLTSNQEIIDYIEYVKKERAHDGVYAYIAELVESDIEVSDEYYEGRECIAVAYGDPGKTEQLLFVDYDECGQITRITVTSDKRLRFKVEEPPEYDRDQDMGEPIVPEDYYDAMLMRAQCAIGLEAKTLDFNEVRNSERYAEWKENAKEAVSRIRTSDFDSLEKLEGEYSNVFGLLFSKAIAMEGHERAFNMSKQFYKDFVRYHDRLDLTEEYFLDEMIDALVYAQAIGHLMKEERTKRQDV